MSNRQQIVVSGRNPEVVEQIISCLSGASELQVVKRLLINGHRDPLEAGQKPAALILALSEHAEEELDCLLQRASEERPPLLIVGEIANQSVMRLAMQAGSRDFLNEPVSAALLIPAIRNILAETESTPDRNKSTTTFINAKGGSGSSLLAANYADILQRRFGRDCLLMDLDRQFAALPHYLDISPAASLFDALQVIPELDEMAVEGFIAKHKTGLSLMSHKHLAMSAELPDENAELDECEGILKLIDLVQLKYPHLVIEVPQYLDSVSATALQSSDTVVMVLQQNIPSIRDAARLKTMLTRELDIPSSRIQAVLNRRSSNSNTELEDVKLALDLEKVYSISNDFKTASLATDMGLPLFEVSEKSPLTANLVDLVCALEGIEKPTPSNVFTRLLRS
ncbi:MAG: AAA family ATPase [Pseudomonadales bacterium]|nr:AAA family ATPase [Pseudomonadales bacterium]